MQKPYLFVGETASMGRGVFTSKRITADTIIEVAPVLVMSNEDRIHIDRTMLHDYIFEWGTGGCCMALGLVPIYNHSYKSNCEYFMDYDASTIMIKTVDLIEKGEELFINYNGDWDNPAKLWFDAR